MRIRSVLVFVAAAICAVTSAPAQQSAEASRPAFRALYQELVEIDSSVSTGSCTKVARAAEARLLAAGFAPPDLQVVIPEGKPDDGNVVAVIHGSAKDKKGLLLLAHIDVVDAHREDWQRDPFKLVEENGFFYGRGAGDDKAMAAVLLDLMIRLKQEPGFRPSRTLKLALTCGEETSKQRTNGIDYLLKHRRELVDADFALNEGAGGLLSPEGKPLALEIQAGEKIHQVYVLEVTNKGGHSSRPVADNAIYRLAAGLGKLSAFAFPFEITPVMREYFRVTGPLLPDATGAAMTAVAKDPADPGALAALAASSSYNGLMRTTCVATQLTAGHAANALPQRARATISCRVMQGTTPEEVQATLEKVVADPAIKVLIEHRRDGSAAPPLTEEVMKPVREVAKKMWPQAVVAPSMTAGATDGRYLMHAGIPTYGLSGMFSVPGEENAHGLDEKIRVKSVYEGRDFLEAVTRAYVK